MRRITWIVALVVGVSIVLAGCGKKDAGAVVNDLDKLVGRMDSYQASGTMILQTGQEPQDYQVEVWFKSKHYYRISLVNQKKDISQIVLRNDDGVFVLTPHLNKSFRFKSDWPENQGQVYLYQSLVQSIIADKARQFTTDNGAYVFDVTANYQNASNLARQRIWLNKKNYAPQHVEVSDANANIKVIVDFKQFEFGKKFDKDSFDMKRNMAAWNLNTTPTVKQPETPKTQVDKTTTSDATNPTAAADAGKKDTKVTEPVKAPVSEPAPAKLTFGILEPSYTPQGVKQLDITEITLAGAKAILIRYTGDYHYSIVESKPLVQETTASALNGQIIDLGFTLGVLTGDDLKTLEWINNGMEFKMSSGDLPQEEMIKVAMALERQSSK
jgi:outer membrane lipoprotein-sorting protein